MTGGHRTRRRSSRVERVYTRTADGDPRNQPRQAPRNRSERSVERQFEQRRVYSRVEGGDLNSRYADSMVNASSSRSGGGSRHHRGKSHRRGDYMYRAQPHRHHPHNNQYSWHNYYGRRDPDTGRFVNASKSDQAQRSSSSSKSFLEYLKDAFGGYGPDKSDSARSAYRATVKDDDMGRRRRDYDYDDDDDDDDDDNDDDIESSPDDKASRPYRRRCRDEFVRCMDVAERNNSVDDKRLERKGRSIRKDRPYRRARDRDSSSRVDASCSRRGRKYSSNGYTNASYREEDNDNDDDDYDDGDDDPGEGTSSDVRTQNGRKVTAGGYGDYYDYPDCAPCGTRRNRCCSSPRPPCPQTYGSYWKEAGDGWAGRPRACSLKAGGNGYRDGNDYDYDDEDYGGGQGRTRTSRGRPRAMSARQPARQTGRSDRDNRVRDRSDVRGGRDRSSDSPMDVDMRPAGSSRGGGGSARRERSGRNLYVPPSDMMRDYDNSENSIPPSTRSDDSDSSVYSDIVLPPFLEGKMTLEAYDKNFPTERLMNPSMVGESDNADGNLYSRMPEFGQTGSWSNSDTRVQYDRGSMYCSNPGGDAAAWRRTALQAHALTMALGRDSLREGVTAAKMPHSTGLLFLIDAGMRLGAILHAGSSGPLPKRNPLPEVFKKLPDDAASLFEGGPLHHARGATAGILRSSYGALLYWPDLRHAVRNNVGSYVDYCLVGMHKAQVYLASRACADNTSLSDFDLSALSECFSVGLVVAAVAAEFIYKAIGSRLHQDQQVEEYEDLTDVEPYVRRPMGSAALMEAEAVCLGNLDAMGDVSVGVAGTLVGAHVGTRSAMTEIMNEFAEGINSPTLKEGEEATTIIVLMAALLQRLLGYLNILSSYLVIAAMYHGRDVKVRAGAFKLYNYLCIIGSPLYRPVTVGEFDDDREKAMRDLGCEYSRGDPPQRQGGSLTPLNTSELDALRLANAESFGPLGDLVPLSEAMHDAREVILGSDAMDTVKAQITGARSIGMKKGRTGRMR